MGVILTYEANDIELYRDAKPFLRRADVLLDVGAGIRPQRFVECTHHICIEAHDEYCDVLRENGFEVVQAEVPGGLDFVGIVDTVIAVDVIEHLTRDDGLAMVDKAKRIALQQVVIFTPLGYMPQDGGEEADPWGYQGQHWQQHRSGWTPDDFPGWRCIVNETFHHRVGRPFGAFFAIWDRPA